MTPCDYSVTFDDVVTLKLKKDLFEFLNISYLKMKI
jgi:hypothetical protein